MRIRVPGDKSMTQRALILAALAEGESRLRGLLSSADPRSTAAALRGLGVVIPQIPVDGAEVRVTGRGLLGLREPVSELDLGNSGTGARLLMGVAAAQSFRSVITGDASLRSRPMGRVARPLAALGARFEWLDERDRLPVGVGPTRKLEGGTIELSVASAQVKSALLLAGLIGGVGITVREPGPSRDHTERMLRSAGVAIETTGEGEGRVVTMAAPPDRIAALDLTVPGDPSSAAFPVLAALLGIGSGRVEVEDVGLNPTRTGFVNLLRRMGGQIEARVTGDEGGEPVGVIRAGASELRAIQVGKPEIVTAIDELPVVAVAASRARGTTRIVGAGELRVKETDRIRALVTNLTAVGVSCRELEDGLEIDGTDAPLRGVVDAFDDHRIAMVFGVLGAQVGNEIRVEGHHAVDVSFPGFWKLLRELAAGG